ncbi:hypothetical protein PHLCEN_2v11534 [Hermanssonia centrifuga]|uniref:Uncharacterized protein n=1 Tax=Hermanssonia centrifuga TaxID=98765 RepID=A0A2R6NJQ8_9APHY|nr:hypothetical protein PHLCEN_2v11534 [Hermanssonia centrifuga]
MLFHRIIASVLVAVSAGCVCQARPGFIKNAAAREIEMTEDFNVDEWEKWGQFE